MSRWSIALAGAFAFAGPMSVMAKPIAYMAKARCNGSIRTDQRGAGVRT